MQRTLINTSDDFYEINLNSYSRRRRLNSNCARGHNAIGPTQRGNQ